MRSDRAIDVPPPDIHLNGSLLDAAGGPLLGGVYRLVVAAMSGHPFRPRTTMRSVAVLHSGPSDSKFLERASARSDSEFGETLLICMWDIRAEMVEAGSHMVRVEAENRSGQSAVEEFCFEVLRPPADTEMRLFGAVEEGQRLVAVPPAALGDDPSFQWWLCEQGAEPGVAIKGATDRVLDLLHEDVGSRWRVTARNRDGSRTASVASDTVQLTSDPELSFWSEMAVMKSPSLVDFREFVLRRDLSHAAEIIRHLGESRLAATYAGWYIDESLTVVVRLKGVPEDAMDLVREVFLHTPRLRFQDACWTAAEMEALVDAIDEDIDQLLDRDGIDISGLHYCPQNGRMIVSVPETTPKIEKVLRERYGPSIDVQQAPHFIARGLSKRGASGDQIS